MRFVDRFLRDWRIRTAASWIPDGGRVLDVGCFQGELLHYVEKRIGFGIGVDPLVTQESATGKYRLLCMPFAEQMPLDAHSFDAIVFLATLEHIRDKESVARECHRLLKPRGRVIITVPEPFVDKVVALLIILRLADGMSLEQHHGLRPRSLPDIFAVNGFKMKAWRKFQLGLNNLFVFERA